MKKNAIASTLALLAAGSMSAQNYQLPNVGFNDYGDAPAIIHTSDAKTRTSSGKCPTSWFVPNIRYSGDIGIHANSQTSNDVNIENVQFGGLEGTRYIPIVGTLSLAQTWYASYGNDVGGITKVPYINRNLAQNGLFGGYDFAGRPDALVGDFRIDTRKNNEVAHVIAYLWNGTYYGEVPRDFDCDGQTALSFKNPRVTGWRQLENVDRAIWSEVDPSIVTATTVQNITKTEGAEVVAYCDKEFDNTFGWSRYEIPLTYKSAATPTMTNVIVAAGNPWNSHESVNGNNIWADNLRYVYYSRLAEAYLSGYALSFDSNTYDYFIEVDDPASVTLPAVAYRVLSTEGLADDKEVAVINDDATKQINLVVTNKYSQLSAEATDADGQSSHAYNFYFRSAPKSFEAFYYTMVGKGEVWVGEPTEFSLSQETNDYRLYTLTVNDVKVDETGEPVSITVEGLNKEVENGVETYSGTDIMAKVGDEIMEVTTYATFNGGKFEVAFSFTNEDGTVTKIVATPEPATSSVAAINGETASVTAADGAVRISNYNGDAAVYTTDGRLAATATVNGTAEISLATGLYIVHTGNAATKVIVK